MGLLSKIGQGLGRGLQQKAQLDWEDLKRQAEQESRRALMEVENTYRTQAADKAHERSVELVDKEDQLATTRLQKAADLAKQQATDPELIKAAEDAARAKARGETSGTIEGYGGLDAMMEAKSRRSIVGYDENGEPIYGTGGKGGKGGAGGKYGLKDVVLGTNPDGTERKETWVTDTDGSPMMPLAEYQAAQAKMRSAAAPNAPAQAPVIPSPQGAAPAPRKAAAATPAPVVDSRAIAAAVAAGRARQEQNAGIDFNAPAAPNYGLLSQAKRSNPNVQVLWPNLDQFAIEKR